VETIASVISVLIVVGLPAAWLASEFCDARKSVRVGLGLAVVAVAVGCFITAVDLEYVNRSAHARCFQQIGVLLDSGDIATVKRAVAAYNEDGKHSPWEAERVLRHQGK